MPSGVDLVRMPGFEYPSSARLDFSPINNAITRHIQAGFQQQQADAEQERLGLEHQRFGLQERQFESQSDLERQRLALQQQEYGLNQQRVGYEGRRLTLAEQQQQQQDEENARIRIGNLAFRIRQLPTPEQRATELGRLMDSSPTFRQHLGSMTASQSPLSDMSTPRDAILGNTDQLLDRMISDVGDASSRYQPRPLVPIQPGTTLLQQGPDGQVSPVATAPPLLRSLTSHENASELLQGQQARLVGQALAEFRPEFTRPGLLPTFFNLGDVNNWIGRHFSNASQAQRDAAAWWQRFYLNTDLQQRHTLFGSAFTASEMQAWNQATITPSMTPQAIIANLQARQQVLSQVAHTRALNLVMAGYDPRQIANVYGVPLESLTSIQPASSLSRPVMTQPGTQPPPAPPPQAPPPGTQPPPPGGGTPIPPLNSWVPGTTPPSTTPPAPVRVTGDSDPAYQALPSGARYIGPDGRVRIKR